MRMDNISEVVPGLYIGDASIAGNTTFLDTIGIDCIINCTKDVQTFPPRCYMRINVDDRAHDSKESNYMTSHLPIAVDFIHSSIKSKHPVLVHCAAGKQRSAAVVVAYLRKYYAEQLQTIGEVPERLGKPLLDAAIEYLVLCRPIVFQFGRNVNFAQSLLEFEKTL